MRFQKNSISIHGKKTSYWEKHHTQKPTIVFLHGFPGSHRGLVTVADSIPDHRLLIPDLPACGASESLGTEYALKPYAAWLNDFLTSLAIERAVIIGHSFGARVALRFGLDHPEKVEKLVLIAPVTKVDSLIGGLSALYYKVALALPL